MDYFAQKVAEGLKKDLMRLAEDNSVGDIIVTLVNITDKLDDLKQQEAVAEMDSILEKLSQHNFDCPKCNGLKVRNNNIIDGLISSADQLDKLGLSSIANDIDGVLKILKVN